MSNPTAALRAKCYQKALGKLRNAHAEEFRTLLHAEYDEANLPTRKRRTPEEIAADKAEKQRARLEREEERRRAKLAKLEAQMEALKQTA